MARRWKRWTAERAAEVLDELAASGLTAAEFARRRQIHPQRLRRWRRRLQAEEREVHLQLVELVPTSAAPAASPAAAGTLRLHCPSGHVIELGAVDLAQGLRLMLAAAQDVGP
jgi:transposase-like protein